MVSLQQFQQLEAELTTARQQINELAAAQTTLKAQAQEAIAASERRSADPVRQLMTAASQTGAAADKIDLVDFKVNRPEAFFSRRGESWKAWSRQFRRIARFGGMASSERSSGRRSSR